MKNEKRFLIVKTKDDKTIKYMEYDKIKGYQVNPKKNVRFEDAINVDRMILINPSLIEKMVDRKIKQKFEHLINLISIVCESDDDSGDGLYLALNEVEKFKRETINKYRNYLNEEKLELLNKKVSILEDELNLRIKYLAYNDEYTKEGKHR